MVWSLRAHIGKWRIGIVAGLCAFALAQTISLAHAADASLHPNDAPCQICQAIGHAAAPPAAATAPIAAFVGHVAAAIPAVAAPHLPLLFSSHAPRGPPASH
ncbi:MAG TPA: hypothetical protein VFG38_08710 [Pseudomonadales bacterium]|nr:hypothetical protein [Pseudomonadales bacterium]